MNKTAKVPRN